jgi:isocitrate lyase
METKTADLADARKFAEAIHAKYPGKMLAYNLSPSFNWDTTGIGDEEMKRFPEELEKLGYVFNFITYVDTKSMASPPRNLRRIERGWDVGTRASRESLGCWILRIGHPRPWWAAHGSTVR